MHYQGRELQTDLFAEDGYQLAAVAQVYDSVIRATDIQEHNRLGAGTDKRADVREAIERVTQKMVMYHSIAKGNYRRIPIEHITRTVIEGHVYHYTIVFIGVIVAP